MEYFKRYFTDVEFGTAEEVKVCCPFHDDVNPSASINTEKSLFHCWVCDVGYNETQFLARVNGISIQDAQKVIVKSQENAYKGDWHLTNKASLWANNEFLDAVKNLGLTQETIDIIDLGITKDDNGRLFLGVPVIYNGVLMDVRSYNLLKYKGVPKMKSLEGAKAGFVIPYDLWVKSTDKTYIFEGEKDMLMARELGLNAITLTGGAGAKPNELVINAFKGREVVICYDNDKAGREGTSSLASYLERYTKSIKKIDIGEVCVEDKEDFYDFVIKYKKDVFDFLALEEKDVEINHKKKYTPLKTAMLNNNIKKQLISKVTVSAEFEDKYAVPQQCVVTKLKETDKGLMFAGQKAFWTLEDNNIHQVLALVESDAKVEQIKKTLKKYSKIEGTDDYVPQNEGDVSVEIGNYAAIYKVRMTDAEVDTGVSEEDLQNFAIDLYTFIPMTVGKQYEVHYKLLPHPTKNQRLVAIANDVYELNNAENFKPKHDLLRQLQSIGTVKDRLDKLFQSAKHYVAKHLDFNLWLFNELVINSVLEFDYGQRIRGALDVFILGDTQSGKSETATKLSQLYNFGHFASLKTSTTVGLIGGSNKVDGSWANTIGAIPRQHKKLMILEEFSGASPDFIKTITDTRSSGRLRFARAAGETNVACLVRYITLSNPINDENGNPRHLSTFPNGVVPIMELVKSAEDVARYDAFVLRAKPTTRLNPFAYKLIGEPIPKEVYEHKAMWVYSRTPEDVVFEDGVESYIWEKAEELNALFECNFPLFGTTTSLKLARFCVALASLLVNSDTTLTKVVVTKDIVDYMVDTLKHNYDNPTFKLKEYKEEYESYDKITPEEIAETQSIYSKNATLFEFLEHQSSTSRNNLKEVSGLNQDGFSKVFNTMVRMKLVRMVRDTVFPTGKFRLAMGSIDRTLTHDTMSSMVRPNKYLN